MATNTVTTEQVREAIEQLAAMVAAASISPQTIADILEMMRNLNDQERLKVVAVAEAYIAQIENTGINAELVNYGPKTVAEALQLLEENILYQETIPHNTFTANDGWETGAYKDDGTFDTSSTLYKTSNKLELDDSGSITMAVAPKLLAFWNGSTWLNRIDNRTPQATTISVPTGATLVAISFDYRDAYINSAVSGLKDITIENTSVKEKIEDLSEEVSSLSESISNISGAVGTLEEKVEDLEDNVYVMQAHEKLTSDDGWETGAYKNDGTFDTSSTLYKTSNKLELDDSGSITMAVAPKLLAFWNGSTWLNRIDNRTTQATTISVPTGATLVAISIDANSAFGISISGLAPTKIPISDKVEEMEETVADLVPLPAEVAVLTEACSESIPHTTMEQSMVRGSGAYSSSGVWNASSSYYWSTWLIPIASTASEISIEEMTTYLCFFDENEEIIGSRIATGDTTHFEVPANAKYFALTYNLRNSSQTVRKPADEVIGTAITGVAPTRKTAMSLANEVAEKALYKIGSEGYIYFGIQVPIGFSNPANSVNVEVNPSNTSEDRCCLLLPPTYNTGGVPTRLIIYCHGASWAVTDSSCYIASGASAVVAQYWASKGFAILEVNGLPEAFHFDWNEGYWMNHYGSPIAIRSYLAAYRYVIDNYNIAQDGVFLIGSSMGGLTVNNLINNSYIPVKGALLDAPVIDLRNDAWKSGNWGVSPHQYEAMTIALLYHFGNCNIDTTTPANSTFTVANGTHAGTYTFAEVTTGGDELMAFFDEQIQNFKGWYPTENKKVMISASEYGLLYRAPLKIWHGDTDPTNLITYSSDFVEKVRAAGQYAELRSIPVSIHTPLKQTSWGSTTDGDYEISNEAYEMWLFMREWS